MIRRPGAPLLLTLLSTVLACGARADDWLQLRHDPNRTGASRDRVSPPLTEIWTAARAGDAVWEGRLYTITSRLSNRFLHCSDVHTGVTLWERPLEGSRQVLEVDAAVAVSPNGLVYAYDWERFPHHIRESEIKIDPNGKTESRYYEAAHTHYILRRFDGRTGTPLEYYPPGRIEAEPTTRVYLGDGRLDTPRQPAFTFLYWRPGPPLLTGERLTALSGEDQLVQWSPGSPARYQLFSHLFPGQPAPGTPVNFLWYPPLAAESGIAISGFGDKRFLALTNGGEVTWHQDFPWLPGIAASEKNGIFLHMQGQGPDGIVGLNAANGEFQWTFAPQKLPPVLARGVGSGSGISTSNGPSGAQVKTYAQSGAFVKGVKDWYPDEIVLKDNRVYGQVLGQMVALAQKTGQPFWRQSLGPGLLMRSVAATQDHLLVSAYSLDPKKFPPRLCALTPESGKIEWSMPVPGAGRLMVGDGLVFMTVAGSELAAYAPAERTFHLAVDSPRREDYRLDLGAPEAEGPFEEVAPKPDPDKEKAEQEKNKKAVADASILRLRWHEPVEALMKKAKERQALVPNAPLVLVLDWLDPTRTSVTGPTDAGGATPQLAAFTRVCEQLAREVRPAHIEIASDLNVYLTRYPERLERVGAFVDAARDAVHKGADNTKVVLSLNAEVLCSRYGRGTYLPFGKLTLPRQSQATAHLLLARRVDELGLTSYPEAAFVNAEQMPGDYFVTWKRLLRDQPLLVTQLATVRDPKQREPDRAQAEFVKRLVQLCYWLDAKVVAYPNIDAPPAPKESKEALPGLRDGELPRLALGYWKDTLAWKRVTLLTTTAARREW